MLGRQIAGSRVAQALAVQVSLYVAAGSVYFGSCGRGRAAVEKIPESETDSRGVTMMITLYLLNTKRRMDGSKVQCDVGYGKKWLRGEWQGEGGLLLILSRAGEGEIYAGCLTNLSYCQEGRQCICRRRPT